LSQLKADLLIEPNLKFLDAQVCHDIFECLKEIEKDPEVHGVFQSDLWKQYRSKHLPEEISEFELFKFDEQITNMYRAGFEGLYARHDYNKFSSHKHEGYSTFLENVEAKHSGHEVSRNDGLIEILSQENLLAFDDFKKLLLAKTNEPWPKE